MKKISYFLSLLLLALFCGCKEQEQPYVGYIIIERAVLDAAEGSTTTITADTDIPSEMIFTMEDGVDWCTVSASGKEITIKATKANPDPSNFRTATIQVRCGYRTTSFTVLQKYEGQTTLQYDWTKWTATGSDVEAATEEVIPVCLPMTVPNSGTVLIPVEMHRFLIRWSSICRKNWNVSVLLLAVVHTGKIVILQ